MTDDDIKRDRELIAAATPGPWRLALSGYSVRGPLTMPANADVICSVQCGAQATKDAFERFQDDAEFIAASRTRWPAALDALVLANESAARFEALLAEEERLRQEALDREEEKDRRIAALEAERYDLRRDCAAATACIAELKQDGLIADRDSWQMRAEALAKVAAFARHTMECATEDHPLHPGPCDCGLGAALQEAGL